MKTFTLLLSFLALCLGLSLAQNNAPIYGLNFTTGQLKLASIDIANGQLNILSQNPLSRDCFGQAVCDIDPVRRRYYYVRQDPATGAELITASLDDGRLLSRITLSDPDPNGSIVPITNIAVNELFALPNSRISMNMGGTTSMTPGQQMQLNAYVGPQASYLWQDGSTQPIMNVSTPGTYTVDINRQGFNIRGEVTVTATDMEEALLPGIVNAFPNPFQAMLTITWSGEPNRPIQYSLRDAIGKIVREGDIMEEISISTRDLSPGGYVLQLTDGSRSQYKLVIKQ